MVTETVGLVGMSHDSTIIGDRANRASNMSDMPPAVERPQGWGDNAASAAWGPLNSPPGNPWSSNQNGGRNGGGDGDGWGTTSLNAWGGDTAQTDGGWGAGAAASAAGGWNSNGTAAAAGWGAPLGSRAGSNMQLPRGTARNPAGDWETGQHENLWAQYDDEFGDGEY